MQEKIIEFVTFTIIIVLWIIGTLYVCGIDLFI